MISGNDGWDVFYDGPRQSHISKLETTMTDKEIRDLVNPQIKWYSYLLLPFWLLSEFIRGFWVHIIKPDPPGWREEHKKRNKEIDQMWDEVVSEE